MPEGIKVDLVYWKRDLATYSLLPDPEKEASNIIGSAGVQAGHDIRQANFPVDFFGLLFWLRDVYMAFVGKFYLSVYGLST